MYQERVIESSDLSEAPMSITFAIISKNVLLESSIELGRVSVLVLRYAVNKTVL